jgi:hypothetical protein
MQVITVSCAGCGHPMKFAADKAGRKAKCPKCATLLTVPAANGPAAAGAAGGSGLPGADDEDGAYGVVIDSELEERRRQLEEEDRKRRKELKKKKAPKVQKKYKSLPEEEAWEKVHFGLLFIFLGTTLWAFSHLLQGMWVSLGSVEFTDYGRLTTELIEESMNRRAAAGAPAIPEDGHFWDFSQYHFLVALAAGRGFASFAKLCLALNLIFYPITQILWFVGCILCLPVPRHHGALGQLILMMVLGGFNALFFLFFRLLPTLGVYRWYVIPYFIPEVMFTEYNMERVYPFFMLWSPTPFWESILAIVLQFTLFLQPIVGVIFIWSCATTLKASRVEENAAGVCVTGLGQYYIWLSYLMIALCGTTPVLVGVLRVLYILWYSFLMMFIVRYALLTWRCRDLLYSRLYPGS